MLSRYNWRAACSAALVSCTAVGVAMVTLSQLLGWDLQLSVRDPLAVARAGDDVFVPYVGWISHLGVLGWALASVAGLVGARLCHARGDRGEARFLLAGAILSGLLLVDDLYLVHESVARRAVGASEVHVIGGLAILAAAWCVGFRGRLLREPDLPILVVAVWWFALSFTFEVVWPGVQEEAAKLIGIICWATFHWRVSVRSALPAQPARTAAAKASRRSAEG